MGGLSKITLAEISITTLRCFGGSLAKSPVFSFNWIMVSWHGKPPGIQWQVHDTLVTVWPNRPRPGVVAHPWSRSSGKPLSNKMTFRSVCEMPAKRPPNRPANHEAISTFTGRVGRLPANICEACQRPPPRHEIVNFDQKWQKKFRGNPPVTKLDISIVIKRTRKFGFPW